MGEDNRNDQIASESSGKITAGAKKAVKGTGKMLKAISKHFGKGMKTKIKLFLLKSLAFLLPYLIVVIILSSVIVAFQSGIFAKDLNEISLEDGRDDELKRQVQIKIDEINANIPEGIIGLPSETRINKDQVLMFANQAYVMISEDVKYEEEKSAEVSQGAGGEKIVTVKVAGEKVTISDKEKALKDLALIGVKMFRPKVTTDEIEINVKATFTELVVGTQAASSADIEEYKAAGKIIMNPQTEEEIKMYNPGTIYELKATLEGTGGTYKIIHIKNPTEKNYKEKVKIVKEVTNIMNSYTYTYDVITETVQGNPAEFNAIGEVTLERQLPVITGRTQVNEKNYQGLKEKIKESYPFSEEDAEMLTEIVANAIDPNTTFLFEDVDYTSGFAYNLADLSQFGIPQEYISYFYEAEKIYKIPAWYFAAVARQESNFDPGAEYKGAHGIMQFQRFDLNGKDLFQYHLDNGLKTVFEELGIKVVSADQAWGVFLSSTRVQVIATSWVVNKYFNMAYRDFMLPKSEWADFPVNQWKTLYAPKFNFELSEENKPLFMKALAYYNAGEGTVEKWTPENKYMTWPYSISVWEYMNQYSGQVFEKSLINWSFNAGSIYRPFGIYKDSATGQTINYLGTLISSAENTPVPVLTGGEVTEKREGHIVIKSKDANDKYIYVEYLNLKDIYVFVGDRVSANQVIATNAYNYLELRIKSNGAYVDPLDFIKKENEKIQESNLAGGEKFKILMAAAAPYEGVPYVFGGNTLNGIDCSGLTAQAYKAISYSLPRTAQGQYDLVTDKGANLIRDINQAKPGDLVFFTKTYNAGRFITHVAIYLGNGRIFEAAGEKVRYNTVSPDNPKFVGFGRVFN